MEKKYKKYIGILGALAAVCLLGWSAYHVTQSDQHGPVVVEPPRETQSQLAASRKPRKPVYYRPRHQMDASGYLFVSKQVTPWPADATLPQIAAAWKDAGLVALRAAEDALAKGVLTSDERLQTKADRACCLVYAGQPERSLALLGDLRRDVESDSELASAALYTVIYLQGVVSLRLGETENCVKCRGECSCILPLQPSAQHTQQTGSRDAVKYFTEYLSRFPNDLEVKWLLNIAHMTLGEHPDRVDPKYLVPLDHYQADEHGIGRFRDVAHLLGIDRLNMAGGAILDDFDGDGLLDLVFSSLDPAVPLAFYRNGGDGRFTDRSKAAGLLDQLGGLNLVQADYNNDGRLDLFVPRGAWLKTPMRPSLLRNDGDKFTDVTQAAGLLRPMNSDNAQFADYDNDGWLDLFVCGEAQPSRLYRNQRDGTFADVTSAAGLGDLPGMWKGMSWFDYDNDGLADLFLNSYSTTAKLLHNDGRGHFTDTTQAMGIDGPAMGLACWTWDYNNDGWLDIFASCYDKSLEATVQGLLGQPHSKQKSILYRNVGGQRFENVSDRVGLTDCYQAMGCNFADFDNDGFLDMYLGTGDHDVASLVPNRLLRNLAGERFADISASSGTGHLQKGHGVGCGDWDRDGDVDLAIEMGGAIPGDKYHNLMFLNPGQGNHWLNVKLVGVTSNRSAIGARIKVVTAGDRPLAVQRSVTSGSSFGANPLEQHLGLGSHDRIAELEIRWPGGQTQRWHDLAADQYLQITEGDDEVQRRSYKPIEIAAE